MEWLKNYSRPQQMVLTWWDINSPAYNKKGVICDGAIRSGKTFCTSISFVHWALYTFESTTNFAICGKTRAALHRELVTPLLPILKALGFFVYEDSHKQYFEVSVNDNEKTRFYLYGTRDESSASIIQGMTFGGVMFDNVNLLPRSFVEQAISRCSLEGAKFWFTSIPEHPYHWFYNKWIKRVKEKNMLYIHFTMDDNPTLSKEIKERYKSLYSGAFYERFIEGKWVSADGLVYPMFDINKHTRKDTEFKRYDSYFLSCDYGTINPFSLGLWGYGEDCGKVKAVRIDEFYYYSQDRGAQLTDEEYYTELVKLAGDYPIEAIIIDPSAASFIEVVKKHGEYLIVRALNNNVLAGIAAVSNALTNDEIVIDENCTDTIKEFSLYKWDNLSKRDSPVKAHDHAMDDIRYFVQTVMRKEATQNESI